MTILQSLTESVAHGTKKSLYVTETEVVRHQPLFDFCAAVKVNDDVTANGKLCLARFTETKSDAKCPALVWLGLSSSLNNCTAGLQVKSQAS